MPKPRKAASARKPKAPTVDDATYASAMTMPGESAPARVSSHDPRASTLVATAIVGTAAAAANINATVCSSQVLRLYRPSRGRSKVWNSRPVRKGLASFLRGEARQRPGLKTQMAATQAGEFEEVESHEALTLLADPDRNLTGSAWWWAMFWMAEVTGASYSLIGAEGGRPVAMYWVPSHFVRVIPSETELIAGFRYGRNQAESVEVGFDEMFYYRFRPHHSRPWDGSTWVSQVGRELDCEAAAIQSEIQRWLNGGIPGSVLEVDPGVNKTQLEQMQADYARNYTGVNKSGATVWLQKAKLMQYASKPHEMQYVEGQDRIEAVVYRHAGVPEPIWKMSESNLASATASSTHYAEFTILPRVNAMAEYLTERLLPMFAGTEGWFFAYDNPVREDEALQATKAASAFTAGLVKRNEARAMMGLEADTDPIGDQYHPSMMPVTPAAPVTNFNLADAFARRDSNADVAGRGGSDVSGVDGGGDAAATEGGNADGTTDTGAKSCTGDAGVSAQPDSNGDGSTAAGLPRVAGRSDGVLDEAGHQHANPPRLAKTGWWYATHEHGGVVTKDDKLGELPPSLERIVNAMSGKIGAWLNGVAEQVHANSDGTITLNGQTAAFERFVEQVLGEALADGGKTQAEALGTAWDVTPDDAIELLDTYRVRLATEVTATLESDLNAALKAALQEGQTVSEASQSIAGALKDQAGYRSERIARTEVSHISARGADVAMQAAGIEEREWLLAGGPCPLCDAAVAARPKAKVGEPFWRIGETVPGTDYTLSFRDSWGSDLHPQCRCGVAAIVKLEGEA